MPGLTEPDGAALAAALVLLLGLVELVALRRWGPFVITSASREDSSRPSGVLRWVPRLRRLGSGDDVRDPLTGMGGRALLEARGRELLAQAERTGCCAVGLVLLDLDGFKHVNDTLGHDAGDQVLAEVARRTRSQQRDQELAVRLGGDEFAMLVLGDDEAALERRAEALLDVLSAPVHVDDVSLTVAPSLGLAVHKVDAASVSDLLRVADEAMYDAKASPSVGWRRPVPAAAGRLGRQLRDELLGAIAGGEQIQVHYQPQVDGWSGAVTGFEALVRWQHPEHGLLLPEAFLPQAERSEAIVPLTRLVLAHALADRVQLQRLAPGCSVAVNVSARSMLGPRLLDDLATLLRHTGASPSDLVLEITEPAPRATTEVRGLLESLRSLGCRVSVHGFGSAQTSLTALWQYPAVREIKIDPAIVRQVSTDPEAERLCRAMVNAAHGLDVRVVAEGVEEGEVVHRLRAMGCDAFQGFWLGAPMPLDDVAGWVAQWHQVSAARLQR
jgi:diguanylate cyclase (GGDEF)-like protein